MRVLRRFGRDGWLPGLTTLVAASTIGVYLLVVVGATTAVLDGAAICPTWPACNGTWVVPFDDPALVAAWGHRVGAVLVGLLVAVTTGVAWRSGAQRRVRRVMLGAVVLYPVQVFVGAFLAVSDAPPVWTVAHLVVAMTLVSTLLVALLWHLESTTTATAIRSTDPGSDPSSSDPPPVGETTVLDRLRAYVVMTKPRLMWLLCLVALAAMGLAAGRTLDPGTALGTLGGGVLAIGASGVFNNVIERDRDAHMDRTADRPLVRNRIPVERAVAFGVVLTIASVGVFLVFTNVVAAGLGFLAILFYSVVYTVVLKPHTDQNIVLGGAVGAFPALIGWAAVEHTVGLPAVVLGAVIFLWTPAHFYNLALAYADDYARAGFPMLPVVRGVATTRRHILGYLGATFLGVVVLGATTRLGWVYIVTVAIVSTAFLWAVVRLFREHTERAAFRAFHASNAYLGGVLAAIVLDTMLV